MRLTEWNHLVDEFGRGRFLGIGQVLPFRFPNFSFAMCNVVPSLGIVGTIGNGASVIRDRGWSKWWLFAAATAVSNNDLRPLLWTITHRHSTEHDKRLHIPYQPATWLGKAAPMVQTSWCVRGAKKIFFSGISLEGLSSGIPLKKIFFAPLTHQDVCTMGEENLF